MHLRDLLSPIIGEENIFFDEQSLDSGEAYPENLKEGLQRADVILMVINDPDDWAGVTESRSLIPPFRKTQNTRLENPEDWVRYEVEYGLDHADHKLLIPVLIDNAEFPQADLLPDTLSRLLDYQAACLDSGTLRDEIEERLNDWKTTLFEKGNIDFVKNEARAIIDEIDESAIATEIDVHRLIVLHYWSLFGRVGQPDFALSVPDPPSFHSVASGIAQTLADLNLVPMCRFFCGLSACLELPNTTQEKIRRLLRYSRTYLSAEEDIPQMQSAYHDHPDTLRFQVWFVDDGLHHLDMVMSLIVKNRICHLGSIHRTRKEAIATDPAGSMADLLDRLHRYLLDTFGDAIGTLCPRLEFLLTEHQLVWPLEDVLVDDGCFGGRWPVSVRLRPVLTDRTHHRNLTERSANVSLQTEHIHEAMCFSQVTQMPDQHAFFVGPLEQTSPRFDQLCGPLRRSLVGGVWFQQMAASVGAELLCDSTLEQLPQMIHQARMPQTYATDHALHGVRVFYDPYEDERADEARRIATEENCPIY